MSFEPIVQNDISPNKSGPKSRANSIVSVVGVWDPIKHYQKLISLQQMHTKVITLPPNDAPFGFKSNLPVHLAVNLILFTKLVP